MAAGGGAGPTAGAGQSLTMTPTESPKLNSPKENVKNQKKKVLEEIFPQLPAEDQHHMKYAPLLLGLNATICGFIAHSSFRRLLNIPKAGTPSVMSLTFLPLVITTISYNWLLVGPLLAGDLNCSSCAVVRGGLIGSVVGAIYPTVLAVAVNRGVVARTVPLKGKQKMLHFWLTTSRPVFKKMSFAMVLQGMTGAYLGFSHHRTYVKMLEISQTKKWS